MVRRTADIYFSNFALNCPDEINWLNVKKFKSKLAKVTVQSVLPSHSQKKIGHSAIGLIFFE